ncbi:MAG TPA: ATP-binding protein [Kofleriaceae bacterium]|jgi:signal transduction histidine kinase|nr:ATP-binding protein [Kofleriaceae bacterium]
MQALAESAQLFAEATTDLDRVLNLVARRFSELIGEATNIRLIDGDELVPVATYHADPDIQRYLREFHDETFLRVGEGISGQVLETGQPYYEPELDLEALKQRISPRFVPIFEQIGITGMIVARLRARGVNLGYVSLFRTGTTRPPYDLDDLHLVRDLADRAALAIDNSRLLDGLERRVAERTSALQSANLELEAFAHSVSHDLRSPLRSIATFSQILAEEHGSELHGDARGMLGSIRKNAERLHQLVDDLLRLSRLGHRALHPVIEVDMNDVVTSAMTTIAEAHPEIAIELSLGELPTANGNADLLRQVWINLLDNAVKYSQRRPIARIGVAGTRENGENRYTVTDNGTGFDPQYADKLFGVFQRLHNDSEFEGTGVGLALVQRIVTRHGGRVWADGRPDVGATFGFALPERLRVVQSI